MNKQFFFNLKKIKYFLFLIFCFFKSEYGLSMCKGEFNRNQLIAQKMVLEEELSRVAHLMKFYALKASGEFEIPFKRTSKRLLRKNFDELKIKNSPKLRGQKFNIYNKQMLSTERGSGRKFGKTLGREVDKGLITEWRSWRELSSRNLKSRDSMSPEQAKRMHFGLNRDKDHIKTFIKGCNALIKTLENSRK